MLNIVGGTYYEICNEPYWDELYGSGLRAVNALANRGEKVNFFTYADAPTAKTLSYFSKALSFDLFVTPIDQSIEFTYVHPLADSRFTPALSVFSDTSNLILNDDGDTIVFGMLEGNAVITGNRVVYDPQSPGNARPFSQNGSSADQLIYILNLAEAQLIVKSADLKVIASYFFEQEKAMAIVIKMGPEGAYLIRSDTPEHPFYISPFITEQVWTIGSGDIFTAVFGFEWMVNGLSLEKAALNASMATAYYANCRSLPIPVTISQRFSPFKKKSGPKKLYLAGPFFTMAQRWLINEFKTSLNDLRIEVFSPLHDVGFGEAEIVAAADLKGLKQSDLILAIADGLDSGTLFEIGYARSLGIPVLVFVEDENEGALTMLKGTGCLFTDDFTTAIYKAYWQLFNDDNQ
jgi:nucleoside 2-deoxyribosyltransferase